MKLSRLLLLLSPLVLCANTASGTNCGTIQSFGDHCAGLQLKGSGCLGAGGEIVVLTHNTVYPGPFIYLFGNSKTSIPLPNNSLGCDIYIASPINAVVSPQSSLALTVPPGVPSGTTITMQLFALGSSVPAIPYLHSSNGVEFVFP